jgi:hypothetical protein
MLYAFAIAAHVVTAVLAIGLVGAIPLAARVAAQAAEPSPGAERLLHVLLRFTQVGFVVMVVTGGLVDVSVGGVFHGAGWFRASIAVLLFTGFAHARARRALRRGNALAVVERWGWVMCASIATLTVLMQIKPFP